MLGGFPLPPPQICIQESLSQWGPPRALYLKLCSVLCSRVHCCPFLDFNFLLPFDTLCSLCNYSFVDYHPQEQRFLSVLFLAFPLVHRTIPGIYEVLNILKIFLIFIIESHLFIFSTLMQGSIAQGFDPDWLGLNIRLVIPLLECDLKSHLFSLILSLFIFKVGRTFIASTVHDYY